jgi:D-glycerate 3-kinase
VLNWIDEFLRRERLPAHYRHTIDDVLVPLAGAIAQRVRLADHMLIVGLCGAQGSGKSTAAAALVELLAHEQLPAIALSIDDFYLPRIERQRLAREIHPLLATRGVPGTHDVELGRRPSSIRWPAPSRCWCLASTRASMTGSRGARGAVSPVRCAC